MVQVLFLGENFPLELAFSSWERKSVEILGHQSSSAGLNAMVNILAKKPFFHSQKIVKILFLPGFTQHLNTARGYWRATQPGLK